MTGTEQQKAGRIVLDPSVKWPDRAAEIPLEEVRFTYRGRSVPGSTLAELLGLKKPNSDEPANEIEAKGAG